jgi:ADP-ribose pyrophosphatase YjhB (NUDIX family)
MGSILIISCFLLPGSNAITFLLSVTSGLVLLKGKDDVFNLPVLDTKQVRLLMVRRKDSMSFMEFVRGKYEIDKPDYVHRLVENMSQDEQQKITTLPFVSLWTQLWGNGRDTHSPEFYDAKDKFEALDRAKIVRENISRWLEPEWGFPKGRRMRGESDLECAIREFWEETNIPREAYTVCKNLEFTEVFTGTNNVQYKHVYFIALLKDVHDININQKLTQCQKREISAVRWMTFDECKKTIRPHYVRRKEVVIEMENAVRTFETLANNQ